MHCTMDGKSTRTLAKAVQVLSKIGTDLYIEAEASGLMLRAVNSIQSAVGNIRFNRIFFKKYDVKPGKENYCKVNMKSCHNVFRHMKRAENCELSIEPNSCKFKIEVLCKLDILKISEISMIDGQSISAVVSKEHTTNVISGTHKLFSEILSHFNTNEEELTLDAKQRTLLAQNFVEGARVHEKFMRSQIKLSPVELETYIIPEDTSITFTLREFKAFLLYAEALNQNVKLKFDSAGCPIFVHFKKLEFIECQLVMSTLNTTDISLSDSYTESESRLSNANAPKQSSVQKRKYSDERNERRTELVKRHITEKTTLSNTLDTYEVFQFSDEGNSNSNIPVTSCHARSVQLPRLQNDSESEAQNNIAANNTLFTIMPQNTESGPQVSFYNTPVSEQNKEEDDCIPQSPERVVNMRRLFARCFQDTYIPREPSPNSQFYAPNSDTED